MSSQQNNSSELEVEAGLGRIENDTNMHGCLPACLLNLMIEECIKRKYTFAEYPLTA